MGNPFEIERKCVRGACRRGRAQRQGLLALFGGKGTLVIGPPDRQIRVLGGVPSGPPRSDWPDRAACRARPAQRALARHFSSNRRELSRDRRTRRLAQYFAPDRDAAVAGFGPQRDVGPRSARPDLCAAYLGRPPADRTRPALLRRRPDAGRRPHRSRSGNRSRTSLPPSAARNRSRRRSAKR